MMILGKTKCGKLILPQYGSNTEVAIKDLRAAISQISVPHDFSFYYTAQRLGNKTGYDVVVPAGDGEDVFFAKRPGNNYLSRFVRKEPQPTKYVSLEIYRFPGSSIEWFLKSSHLGYLRLPEIDFYEGIGPTEEELDYWNNHAFCWGYVGVVPGTITDICPWEP